MILKVSEFSIFICIINEVDSVWISMTVPTYEVFGEPKILKIADIYREYIGC